MGPSLLFPGLPLNENTRRTIAQKIRAMFVGGVGGAWYDPSDLSTMFSDSAGSAAITTNGQTVALMLDKRFGLALGPALNFSGAWSVVGSLDNASGLDSVVTATNPSGARTLYIDVGLVNAQWYEIIYTISNQTAGDFYVDPGGAAHGNTSRAANGTYREIRRATPNANLYVVASAGAIGTLTINSVKTITGNHAYQTTSASRPIFRDVGGLRYLEFDGVDDCLRAAFTVAQPIERISALRQVTWTDGEHIFGGNAVNGAVLLQSDGVSPRINMYSGSHLTAVPALALGVNGVVTERHNGATSRGALNSGAYVTGDVGTDVPGGITIGARFNVANFANIFLHQMIMRGSTTALTDTQITFLRKVCYAAAGLPFPGYEETEVSRMFSSAPTAEGAWYDPSDLSTMFLAASGAQTPVTATGSVVGLMLDKSKGLARGADLSINGDFSSNGSGWNVTGNDGTHVITWNNPGVRYQSDTTSPVLTVARPAVLTAGVWYEVDVTISGYTSGSIKLTTGSGVEPSIPTSIGTHRVYVPGLTGGVQLGFLRNSSNTDLVVSSIVARPIAGNHAYQLTAASRPIYRDVGGLRYLEFDGVDDYLRATFTIAQPIDRISAIQQVTWTGGNRVYGGVLGPSGILYQHDVTPKLGLYSGAAVVGPNLALGVAGVITELHSGAASKIALNDQTALTGAAGASAPGGITLGATYTNTQPGNFFLYQTIMRGSTTAMTDAQISACRALCAIKSGVTL